MDREGRRREEERPVREAGGGESEGFEEAEAALREAAEHGDEGEADSAKSSERPAEDR